MLQGAAWLSGHEVALGYAPPSRTNATLSDCKQHCPRILAQLAAEDRFLLEYVQQQFTDYLKCGHLEHGFVRVRYELKTPYSIGTTHVIFEPMVFIARLATLVPKSRVNLTCLHSVFVPQQHTPNSRHTSQTRQGTKTAKATSLR